ncbi:MAG: hypothetical protein Kow0074_06160 [Candidatus Zixiibacteriota bacterium]
MSRVLFVDDEPHVLDGLKRMLRGQGFKHECIGVVSAKDAIDLLSRELFDVVVSDVRMPDMDGVELLARIKGSESWQHIPVIMLTGYSDTDAKRTVMHLGAYDFINKPADGSELVARLENAMRLKRYEDTLRDQNAILERQLIQAQKMEVVGLLASGLAHDLNNILGAIVGHTELARLSAKDDLQLQQYLSSAAESSEHAINLVRQILNLGRQIDSENRTCDLASEIHDSLRLLSAAFPSKIHIQWEKPATAMRADIDSTQVHQILMNLCTNAVQAMDGEGTLTVRLGAMDIDPMRAAELGLPRGGRYARLSVADTGPGISGEIIQQIFDPFFTTKPKGKGTGIGLSVVKRIIENHEGVVNVASAPEHGATFNIYLPLSVENTTGGTVVELGGHHGVQEANPVR